MKNLVKFNTTAKILLIVAGLCWGLVGAFDYELVAAIFGSMSALTRIIYVLFGVAAIYKIVLWKKAKHK